jgi:hypothetical protein
MNSDYIAISPESSELLRRMADDGTMRGKVCLAIDRQNQITGGHIQQAYLKHRGPMTLGVVTARLWQSMRASEARVVGRAIESGIGSNVVYAGAHEFGFNDDVPVKEFTRRNPAADRYSLMGETVSRFTALRLGALTRSEAGKLAVASGHYKFAKAGAVKVKSGTIKVKAHTRHMQIKARHYTFRGIQDKLPDYGRVVSAAIMRSWKGQS